MCDEALGQILFAAHGSFKSTEPEKATFELTPAAGALSVKKFVEHFLVAVPSLPDLSVSSPAFDADLKTGFFSFKAQIDGEWTIPVGVTPPKVTAPRVLIKKDAASVSGSIAGRVKIAGNDIDVAANLPGELKLAGQLPSVTLSNLGQSLAGSSVTVPNGFPSITLPAIQFEFRIGTDTAVFVAGFQITDFGDGFVVVLKHAGEWEFVTGFALPENWKFANLSNVLTPLDTVLTNFTPPALVLSSFDDDTFHFPPPAPARLPTGVQAGATVSSNLKLSGPILNFLAVLLKRDELPLVATLAGTFANTKVRASFNQTITVFPGLLTFDNVAVSVTTVPVVTFSADARVAIDGVPLLTASAVIAPGQTSVGLATAEVWNHPFGISNLVINKLAVQFSSGPPPVYGFLGDVTIAGNPIQMFVQLTGNVPTAISGKFPGELSIIRIVGDLVGLNFPTTLPEIIVSAFAINAVSPPGADIAGVHFAPGLSVQGKVNFFGLKGEFLIEVDPNKGVHAVGKVDRVTFGSVLVISDTAGTGGPNAELETRAGVADSPFLKIDGLFSLLGLKDSLKATVNKTSLDFKYDHSEFGIAHYTLECKATSLSHFQAKGSFEFGIDESISLKRGDFNIGTLSLKAGVKASLDISLIENAFNATFDAAFSFAANDLQVAQVTLSATPDSLDDIRKKIVQDAIDRVKSTFTNTFNDVGKFLLAVKDGLIQGVENVAKVLKDAFNQNPQEIGAAIRDTLGRGSQAAADGLKSIGESAESVAKVLKTLGDPVEKVGGILKTLGNPANSVQSALESAGFPAQEINSAVSNLFPPPPHVKVVPPHVKVVPPHVKVVPPHVKVVPQHVKVVPPHVKVVPPHVKVVPPHVKVAPPHVKTPSHIKFP